MKLYEIIIADAAIDPGVELVHDDPRTAAVVFESMRGTFGWDAVAILRDGLQITVAQLTFDIEIFEIEQVIEQDSLLPSGYRHGVRGVFCSGYLGYYAFVPHNGRGYMKRALSRRSRAGVSWAAAASA